MLLNNWFIKNLFYNKSSVCILFLTKIILNTFLFSVLSVLFVYQTPPRFRENKSWRNWVSGSFYWACISNLQVKVMTLFFFQNNWSYFFEKSLKIETHWTVRIYLIFVTPQYLGDFPPVKHWNWWKLGPNT